MAIICLNSSFNKALQMSNFNNCKTVVYKLILKRRKKKIALLIRSVTEYEKTIQLAGHIIFRKTLFKSFQGL